jgi:cation transport ATPase
VARALPFSEATEHPAGWSLTPTSASRQDPPRVITSGFHRLELLFALASVAVWAYFLNEWWGGEWWSLLLAVVVAIPVGLVFAILPSILLRALRRLPVSEALLTWVFILGGIALGVYAVIAFEGTTLAMFVLAGVEIFGAGLSAR